MRKTLSFALSLLLVLSAVAPAVAFTVPVAASFSTAVPADRQSVIALQGSDAEGTSLVYATTSTPSHGALSSLNTATGYVVYTPTAGYTGSDSFTYTVTSGGETSAAGTVTITVTNAKTTVTDTITDPSGTPRSGKVTFILTQQVTTPAGLAPVGSSVSAALNSSGTFTAQLYPSRSMNPAAYYQVYFNDAATLNQELLGVYDIPASTTVVTLSPNKVTDANLAARYTFASAAAVSALSTAVAAATLSSLLTSSTAGKLQKYDGSQLTDSLVTEAGGAGTVVGNGAGITGLSGGATGSIANPGSTTIEADDEVTPDGVGVIDLQTRNTTRLRVENDGFISEYGPLTGSNLSAVIAAVGSAQRTLRVATPQTLAASLTVPSNVAIEVTDTGTISVASGQTLTVQGALVAPPRHIFTGAGLVRFTGNSGTAVISPDWWGAKAGDGSDDTAAFQAALDAVGASAVDMQIVASRGVYTFSGGVVDPTGCNAQLCLPTRATGPLSITLAGVAPAATFAPSMPPGSTVLRSTRTTGGGAFLGGKGTSSFGGLVGNTLLSFHLRDMQIQAASNPTYSGLDLTWMPNLHISNVFLHTGEEFSTSFTEPTTATSYGIKGPANNISSPYVKLDNVEIFGFYTGLKSGELVNGHDVTITFSKVAVEIPEAYHQQIFRNLWISQHVRGIKFTGPGSTDIGGGGPIKGTVDISATFEHHTSTTAPAWAETVYDLDDGSNHGAGLLRYHVVNANVGVRSDLRRNGGFWIWEEELNGGIDPVNGHVGGTSPNVWATKSANQSIAHNTEVSVTFNTHQYIDKFGLHSTSSNTERFLCKKLGRADLRFSFAFAANATGMRTVLGYKNISGVGDVLVHAVTVAAVTEAGEVTSVAGSFEAGCTAPTDYFHFKVVQKNGGAGALNLIGGLAYVSKVTMSIRR
ncbi:MAG: cadherin-like domain-containing protein [Acidobacteria bacterium]|nr:cadherin-like domain-containing protein [Acidobacteriota bacterium]MCA1620716.1 cadherin-like domain-containing protein [Acidobacteriota bacterium]